MMPTIVNFPDRDHRDCDDLFASAEAAVGQNNRVRAHSLCERFQGRCTVMTCMPSPADEIRVDARRLEPPEPMEQLLRTLDLLRPALSIRRLLHREPFLLYPLIAECGSHHITQSEADGSDVITDPRFRRSRVIPFPDRDAINFAPSPSRGGNCGRF